MRGVCLVCLADGTSSDVLLDKFLHFGPPIVLRNGKKSAGYPWMTCGRRIVVLFGYLPPKVIIFHNNKTSRVPPMEIVGGQGEFSAQCLHGRCILLLGCSDMTL